MYQLMLEVDLHRHGPSLRQSLQESIDSLRLLGRRSLLALLGIAIGSASIVALLNIGHNAADDAISAFKSMGTDTLVIAFPFSSEKQQPLPPVLDTQALLDAVPGLAYIAPLTLQSAHARYQGRATQANLVGTTSGLFFTLGLYLESGRFISDYDQRSTFAIVGSRVAQELGAPGRPLRVGDLLQVEGYLLDVIGILRSQPSNGLIPVAVDDSVFTPIESIRRLRPEAEISNIIAKATSTDNVQRTAERLTQALKERFQDRDVEVQVPLQLLDGLKRQANTFSYLLAGLGSISLLVGGVGVMNVMLMNVAERRREIGVRMALGARARDIRTLFLLEAAMLSVIGSLMGAAVGLGMAYVFVYYSGWSFSLALESLPMGVGGALATGLFFGLNPALAASRLPLVEILRDD